MPRADLIIHSAEQVVTCASARMPKRSAELAAAGVIARGAIAISDGLIVDAGATDEVCAAWSAPRTVDASGRVLCPGFIDCHTHLVFAGERVAEWEQKVAGASYLEILAAGGGILSTMRATRAAPLEHLLNCARDRLDTMFALGSTTVEVKTGYGLNLESELKCLEVVGALQASHACDLLPTLLAAHATPPEFTGDSDGYVDLVTSQIIPAAAQWYAASPFAGKAAGLGCDVFCEDHAFSVAQSRRVLEAGIACGLRPTIHADQFNALGGVSLAVELGARSADHLDVTTPEECARIAGSPTAAVLLPAVPFHLGSCHYPNARALIDAGAALALATDFNPGSAPCFSLPMVMAIACRYLRMTPAEALNACTINAACALGIGDRVGSLELGKQADVLVLNLPDYRHIAYWLGVNPVERIIKRGKFIG